MNIFYISDLHLGHSNIVKFLREDNTKLRPWNTLDEMHDELRYNWNSVVKKSDKVYVLGDLAFNKRGIDAFNGYNGIKILIKGNHDVLPITEYTKHFEDVRAYHVTNSFVLSHMPIHEESLKRFKVNIHGHTHVKNVMKNGVKDERYFNVSVEQINYTPIEQSVLLEQIKHLI